MAFGFPPSFSTEYSTQIDEAEIVPAFKNIITQLGWKVKAVTEKSITGVTIGSAMSWKENLSIGIVDPNKIRIKSKSSFQIIDYGINEQNVNILLDSFIEFEDSISQPKSEDVSHNIEVKQDEKTQNPQTQSGNVDVKAELENLKDMVDNGLITKDDYDLKKKEILNL